MNIIPARVAIEAGTAVAEMTAADGSTLRLRLGQEGLNAWHGRDILLGIRPESITHQDRADRKSGNIAVITNLVGVTEPAGSDTFVTMTLGGKEIIARVRADTDVRAGREFTFAVNMEKAVLFDPETEMRIGPA